MSQRPAPYCPRARTEGLVVEPVGDEMLVYDLSANLAHGLSPTAAMVWEAADGRRDVAQLASLLVGLDPAAAADAVHHILGELADRELLADDVPTELPHVSRRQLLARLGAVGAATLAFPLVDSILAPLAAQQASCLQDGADCELPADCCSGFCIFNTCGDCSGLGEPCTNSDECCPGLLCCLAAEGCNVVDGENTCVVD